VKNTAIDLKTLIGRALITTQKEILFSQITLILQTFNILKLFVSKRYEVQSR